MIRLLRLLAVTAILGPSASYAYVVPMLGGGQAAEEMKHATVTLVGTTVAVEIDESVPTPLLRALAPPDEFDPAMPWHVLAGTAHNFQYGWNAGGFISIPAGAGMWVEQLAATPGLAAYHAWPLPASPGATYALFGTAGSSPRWKWSGLMTHNAYAVTDPTLAEYQATYRVYIGDATTGQPWAQYTPAEVTLTWLADVRSADFDGSGAVDGGDFLVWQREAGRARILADGTGDGAVDGADLVLWAGQFGQPAPGSGRGTLASGPEPSGMVLAGAAAIPLCQAARRRRRRQHANVAARSPV